jgi:addiction module HigA family antidote
LKSLTTTDLLLVPPGEVLLEEFLRPMGISQYRLAKVIDVPESRINAIVKGRRTITADTDLRLCRFFGLTEGFWLRMQASHDLKQAKQSLESVLPRFSRWDERLFDDQPAPPLFTASSIACFGSGNSACSFALLQKLLGLTIYS